MLLSSFVNCKVNTPVANSKFNLCVRQPERTFQRAASTVQNSQIILPPLDDNYESIVKQSSYSNWVLPGHLMLGRYPYMDSVQCTTHEQGEQQLTEILKQGINTFVCLLSQLPPQEDMKIGGEEGFYPYKPPADLIAASLSEHPPMDIVEGLRNPQLDKYLPPRKKQPNTEWHPIKLNYLHMPIGPIKQFEQEQIIPVIPMVDDLAKRVQDGDVLYIHCSGGTGRASVMGACVLVKLFGITADEALERTNRGIDTRSGGDGPAKVRSHFQDDFVNAYVNKTKR